jgi:uncharacterized membrane protein
LEKIMTDQTKTPTRFPWKILIAVVLVLILVSLFIPGVRAAVSGWLGISIAPSAQATVVPVTLEAIATSTPAEATNVATTPPTQTRSTSAPTESIVLSMVQSAGSTGAAIDIAKLSSQVGWNVLTPSQLPEGYQFQSAYFDTNQKMLVLTYLVTRPLPGATDPALTSSETITLLEALHNDFIPMQIAPNTDVADIQVNGTPAAYSVGGWDTEFVKDNQSPGGGKMVSSWRNDLPVKNLFWQVGKLYLTLVTADEAVTQQQLIDMAASIAK